MEIKSGGLQKLYLRFKILLKILRNTSWKKQNRKSSFYLKQKKISSYFFFPPVSAKSNERLSNISAILHFAFQPLNVKKNDIQCRNECTFFPSFGPKAIHPLSYFPPHDSYYVFQQIRIPSSASVHTFDFLFISTRRPKIKLHKITEQFEYEVQSSSALSWQPYQTFNETSKERSRKGKYNSLETESGTVRHFNFHRVLSATTRCNLHATFNFINRHISFSFRPAGNPAWQYTGQTSSRH